MYQITSDKLRLIRALANASQRELAEIIGVNHKSVSAWEANRSACNSESVAKIVNFVGEENFKLIDARFYAIQTQDIMKQLQRKVHDRS
ncbi:helix-turn-helix transcriptional regulator [Bacillus toyonensis]|uniref:helix-turn-helix transcriptional regulator n=1 Tax=Bacillus toyonensis TaxID=155322 RepID=UPI000BEB72B6|nr:helix-turn-helix transcriptional regulator [Bacillus toyonensis]PED95170.1 hypothetical protein CON90_08760 [Bacillus toyonensis]HDR7900371.1 helix-turn-helix transcriptional regulator [Bacillus cereus]HDX9612068.1 helix-turn-helix transcriptional regulator [Bacillus toyonensis]